MSNELNPYQDMSPMNGKLNVEMQRQIATLNARINNATLAYDDLLKEINCVFKMMLNTIEVLQREATEIKAKAQDKA